MLALHTLLGKNRPQSEMMRLKHKHQQEARRVEASPFPCCAGAIEGFAVSRLGKASLLWSAAFPPDSEAILGVAAAVPNAPIYSYAKVSTHPTLLVWWDKACRFQQILDTDAQSLCCVDL